MKLPRRRELVKPKKSLEVLGKTEQEIHDPKELLEKDWDHILQLVESVVTRQSEDFDLVTEVLDIFPERRMQVIQFLKERMGSESFSYERCKSLIQAMSYGEDEAFMSMDMSGVDTKPFSERIKLPKGLVVYLLFPEKREEVLKELEQALDAIQQFPDKDFFPEVIVRGLRLDGTRRSQWAERIGRIQDEQLKALKQDIQENILPKSQDSKQTQVTSYSLDDIATVFLLYPDFREVIAREFGEVFKSDSPAMQPPQRMRDKIRWARAMRILQADSAQIGLDGLLNIEFKKSLGEQSQLPERLTA